MLDTEDAQELMAGDAVMSLREFESIVEESINQPPWRATADKEADYADGNQLSTDLLRKQAELGIPPAKENVITPAIKTVCGYEAKTRTDWRVTPDGDPGGQDVADALNFKLNKAERHSRADRALSQAFQAMVTVGLGWVEVARAANSLQFPYRCRYVHRNEIWWDMQAQEPDLSDARWLFRRRWVDRSRAAQMFPAHARVIMCNPADLVALASVEALDGGHSTGLLAAANAQRAWTNTEDHWYNTERKTVCITEVWYRRWVDTDMLVMHDGRAVEFDPDNQVHQVAVMSGRGRLVKELIPKMRMGYWMGPHQLHDGETPYPHQKFPYVPVFGYREDMTGIPYGLVRDMLFPQDNLNSAMSKLRWGMAAVRTERTKGAVAMSDAQFRRQVARNDADIILDDQHMAKQGARFEVKRDFQLNSQQFQMLEDSRRAVGRVSGITDAFQGRSGGATSGIQEQTRVEQSETSIADLMDQFKDARQEVGDLLLSLIIEDLGKEEQAIVIEGDVINEPRTVVINHPEVDPATGIRYLSNDVQRTRLVVALEDVPSSSSFRAQQLFSMSETIKSLPAEMQLVMVPFMVDLMDLPRKKQVVEALREAQGKPPDPEQMRKEIEAQVRAELGLEERKVIVQERKADSEIKRNESAAVQTGVQSSYSAMQGAAQVVMNPAIAPVADEIMKGAGWKRSPDGEDPDFPVPAGGPGPVGPLPQGGENTSPAYPPVPQEPGAGMTGIETVTPADNMPA